MTRANALEQFGGEPVVTKQWWYISTEDMETVRAYLLAQADADDKRAKEALHTLESGLHQTNAVPDDYAKDEQA